MQPSTSNTQVSCLDINILHRKIQIYKLKYETYKGNVIADPDQLSQNSQGGTEEDYWERLDIPVRTKGPELIGRLACVLWVYCNGKSFGIM